MVKVEIAIYVLIILMSLLVSKRKGLVIFCSAMIAFLFSVYSVYSEKDVPPMGFIICLIYFGFGALLAWGTIKIKGYIIKRMKG